MPTHARAAAPPIFSIGHSTRTAEELIDLLKHHEIQHLVDIRTLPGSRRFPQFNREQLERSLQKAGIDYSHLAALGGLRRGLGKSSPNLGWRNASFRGFADYMQTEEFEKGLLELMDLARSKSVAIMCAEAVPWRCHRSLVSDALLARGVAVRHIISKAEPRPHQMTPFAKKRGQRVTYPAPPAPAQG